MRQLIDSNDAVLVEEHHNVKNRGGYGRHGIHITPPKEYIIIQVSICYLNVYVDYLASEIDRDVLVEADGS